MQHDKAMRICFQETKKLCCFVFFMQKL